MTQQDRDRLAALRKAKKGLITQRQAAEEIGQSERHIRRLLKRLTGKGATAVVHALRSRRSNAHCGLDAAFKPQGRRASEISPKK
jgi:DNA-binding Lrp family transcriptional regulator